MTTQTPGTTLIPVLFRDATLSLIDHNGEPYVAMRPLVEAMGMNWKSQFDKILRAGSRFVSTVVEITTVAQDGKQRKMICLPLRKLTGWMMTIHPGNVRPELRERIKDYQAECDDALWQYWTAGHATRPAAPVLDWMADVVAHGSTPTVPLPSCIQSALNRHAWSLAHEAYEILREHMARALAYHCEVGAPRKALLEPVALRLIEETTLDSALAPRQTEEIRRLRRLAQAFADVAAQTAKDITTGCLPT